MAEITTTLTAEEFILIRRALEAYHVYLMALNKNDSSLSELERVERIFAKIGELRVTDGDDTKFSQLMRRIKEKFYNEPTV